KMWCGGGQGAPDGDKDTRIGPGCRGPAWPIAAIKAINGFARIGWYYEQIYRLADGLEPDLSMSALRAVIAYEKTEKNKARELVR
ncbi:MAG: NADH:flavin oxidoreductase, partial [Gammaproteobacteria bacterium]|nr:NADH:flavin oxidoreductase [Gammaproteobacteria bacterium]